MPFLRRMFNLTAPALVSATTGCGDRAELPVGPDSKPAHPTMASAALTFRQVIGGGEYTCGVTTNDRAFCRGRNTSGQRRGL
jgi:hypothetical protein